MKIKKIHPKILRIGELELLFTHNKDKIKPYLSDPDKYDTLTERFIKSYSSPKEFPKFRQISFPFTGFSFIDNLNDIFNILPEFVASIIEVGFKQLVTLNSKKKSTITDPIDLGMDSLKEASLLINNSYYLTKEFLESPMRPPDIRNEIFNNLDLIKITKPHSNLLGCLQIIHEYLYMIVSNPEIQTNQRESQYPIGERKNQLLEELVKPIIKQLYKIDYLNIPVNAKEREKETRPKKMRVKNLFFGRDDIRWKNVVIEIKSDQVALIKTKDFSERYNYVDLGLDDGRKTDLPARLWKLLLTFAEYKGEIPYPNNSIFSEKRKLEKAASDLRKKLRYITGLKSKPISYFRPGFKYTTYFTIRDSRPRQYHDITSTEIDPKSEAEQNFSSDYYD